MLRNFDTDPVYRFWLNTVKINWNEVQVDYPKNTGYLGKSTSMAPYALWIAGVVAAGLFASGQMTTDSLTRTGEMLIERVRHQSLL